MGGFHSKSEKTSLECILKKWKFFKTEGLKKEKLKFYCSSAQTLFKLGNGEKWPENGSLNYNNLLQLDLYCRQIRKWSEIPYIQAFTVLYQNPTLCGSCNLKPGEPGSPNTLDDLLLSSDLTGWKPSTSSSWQYSHLASPPLILGRNSKNYNLTHKRPCPSS